MKRLGPAFTEVVKNCFTSFDNINFFIHRVKPYNPIGRLQTGESDKLSEEIKECFAYYKQDLIEIDGNKIGYDDIVETTIETLKDMY